METFLQLLFGNGPDLTTLQMVMRGVVVFLVTLVLVRISGRRSFAQLKPFDACITVLLGAILSRAVVGASPFLPTLSTGLAIVLVHRVIAMLTIRSTEFDRIINGRSKTVVRDGQFDVVQMRSALICEEDVIQAIRASTNSEHVEAVRKAVVERDGSISVVTKK